MGERIRLGPKSRNRCYHGDTPIRYCYILPNLRMQRNWEEAGEVERQLHLIWLNSAKNSNSTWKGQAISTVGSLLESVQN